MGQRISEIDAYVGARLRALREQRGLTRQTVAQVLKISNQQLQKYEAGENRISAGKLPAVAQYFGVQIGYFYEGLPAPELPTAAHEIASRSAVFRIPGTTAECRAMLTALLRIRRPEVRRSVKDLISLLADDNDEP